MRYEDLVFIDTSNGKYYTYLEDLYKSFKNDYNLIYLTLQKELFKYET